jgi:hypothetical protein
MYGNEDKFVNSLIQSPWTWRLNHGSTKTRPTLVTDVAAVLQAMLDAPKTSTSALFTLPGPTIYTHKELLQLITAHTRADKPLSEGFTIPKKVFEILAGLQEKYSPWPSWSKDEVIRRVIDDEGTELEPNQEYWKVGYQPTASDRNLTWRSWQDLGVEPAEFKFMLTKFTRGYWKDEEAWVS